MLYTYALKMKLLIFLKLLPFKMIPLFVFKGH